MEILLLFQCCLGYHFGPSCLLTFWTVHMNPTANIYCTYALNIITVTYKYHMLSEISSLLFSAHLWSTASLHPALTMFVASGVRRSNSMTTMILCHIQH